MANNKEDEQLWKYNNILAPNYRRRRKATSNQVLKNMLKPQKQTTSPPEKLRKASEEDEYSTKDSTTAQNTTKQHTHNTQQREDETLKSTRQRKQTPSTDVTDFIPTTEKSQKEVPSKPKAPKATSKEEEATVEKFKKMKKDLYLTGLEIRDLQSQLDAERKHKEEAFQQLEEEKRLKEAALQQLEEERQHKKATKTNLEAMIGRILTEKLDGLLDKTSIPSQLTLSEEVLDSGKNKNGYSSVAFNKIPFAFNRRKIQQNVNLDFKDVATKYPVSASQVEEDVEALRNVRDIKDMVSFYRHCYKNRKEQFPQLSITAQDEEWKEDLEKYFSYVKELSNGGLEQSDITRAYEKHRGTTLGRRRTKKYNNKSPEEKAKSKKKGKKTAQQEEDEEGLEHKRRSKKKSNTNQQEQDHDNNDEATPRKRKRTSCEDFQTYSDEYNDSDE